jgi:hypothetical protein
MGVNVPAIGRPPCYHAVVVENVESGVPKWGKGERMSCRPGQAAEAANPTPCIRYTTVGLGVKPSRFAEKAGRLPRMWKWSFLLDGVL